MASELKPTQWQYWTEGRYWKDCTKEYAESLAKINVNVREINTRPAPADLKARDRKRYKLIRKSLQNKGLLPAATDTGLETIGYVREDFIPNYVTIWSVPHGNSTVAVCLRSQAEELLAAKEAERAEQWRLRREMEADRDTQRAIATSLENELAAERAEKEELDAECRVLAKRCIEKDARIKKLETELENGGRVKGVNTQYANALAYLEMTEDDDPEEFAKRIWDEREALEAKLAAAEKVRVAAEHVVWFDWSDNDDDAVKAVSDLRAVLEGKPYKCEWQQRAETAETKLEAAEKELERLTEFANSFHITVVDNFYKDVTLHLDVPHSLSIRIPNDSTKSFIFKDLEERRRAVLGGKLS